MKRAILRGFGVTAFTFLVMFGVSKLTTFEILSAFDPIGKALDEFDVTDYVFSHLRPQPDIDDRIVLVNIGETSRMEVAQMISAVSQHKPRVIGVDGFFNCEGGFYDVDNCPQLLDTLGNLMLASAIQEAGNVVMVARLLQSDSLSAIADSLAQLDILDVYDSMEVSDPMFSNYAKNAFANLPTGDRDGNNVATYQEDVKICKSLIPRVHVNGEEMLAFSVTMAMMYDSVKAKKFLARGNEEELINFRGNIDISSVKIEALRKNMNEASTIRTLCPVLDHDQVLNGEFAPEVFQDKVVIFGFLGKYLGDTQWEDKFFTPMNAKVSGRANPDMYGPVIHANAVAMILNEDYIDETPLYVEVLTAVLMCFLNALLFYWVDNKFPSLFDGLSVVLQIVQILLVSALMVYIFLVFDLKLEFGLTMIVLALIGPCFDMYKSLENTLIKSLTSRVRRVLTTQNQAIS
jgi:CHASE2 domain-containing sensor protein